MFYSKKMAIIFCVSVALLGATAQAMGPKARVLLDHKKKQFNQELKRDVIKMDDQAYIAWMVKVDSLLKGIEKIQGVSPKLITSLRTQFKQKKTKYYKNLVEDFLKTQPPKTVFSMKKGLLNALQKVAQYDPKAAKPVRNKFLSILLKYLRGEIKTETEKEDFYEHKESLEFIEDIIEKNEELIAKAIHKQVNAAADELGNKLVPATMKRLEEVADEIYYAIDSADIDVGLWIEKKDIKIIKETLSKVKMKTEEYFEILKGPKDIFTRWNTIARKRGQDFMEANDYLLKRITGFANTLANYLLSVYIDPVIKDPDEGSDDEKEFLHKIIDFKAGGFYYDVSFAYIYILELLKPLDEKYDYNKYEPFTEYEKIHDTLFEKYEKYKKAYEK